MPTSRYQLFDLNNIKTDNFLMTPLELKDYLDFEVKRVYFISSPEGEKITGQHCHRQDEDELFIQIQGSCEIIVDDDGSGKKALTLTGPKSAIYIPHLVWHGFKNLSDDAIILALTSTNYITDRSDYCEDYQEFQSLVKDLK